MNAYEDEAARLRQPGDSASELIQQFEELVGEEDERLERRRTSAVSSEKSR